MSYKENLKKVVIIAGGNGSAKTICALKPYADQLQISAVIPMSDSGGSSGILRQEFDCLPPGDIMRAVLALSRHEYAFLKSLFYGQRFRDVGKLNNHNVGNLFLALAAEYGGDFVMAVRALEQAVEAVGQAYPASIDPTNLCVELSNGEIVRGEAMIDRPAYDRNMHIVRAWLEPTVELYRGAREVILEADYIVFGPGSFYTSIVAALLPEGMKETIAASHAQLVFVSGNAVEINGETGPRVLSEFIHELENYLPRPLDLVVYNNHSMTPTEIEAYRARNWVTYSADTEYIQRRVIMSDYERSDGGLSSKKIGNILMQVFTQ